MCWLLKLLKREDRIERHLATRHLSYGALVCGDTTSVYFGGFGVPAGPARLLLRRQALWPLDRRPTVLQPQRLPGHRGNLPWRQAPYRQRVSWRQRFGPAAGGRSPRRSAARCRVRGNRRTRWSASRGQARSTGCPGSPSAEVPASPGQNETRYVALMMRRRSLNSSVMGSPLMSRRTSS